MNQIQGWTTVREYHSRALKQGSLEERQDARVANALRGWVHFWGIFHCRFAKPNPTIAKSGRKTVRKDTMNDISEREGEKEWNYLSFEEYFLSLPNSSPRNNNKEKRGRAVRANNDLGNNGGRNGVSEEDDS